MSLHELRLWPLRKKVIASLLTIVFSVVVIGGVVGLFIYDDMLEIAASPAGQKINDLAQGVVDLKIDEIGLYKGIHELNSEIDASLLNRGFYAQIGYNVIGFLIPALILGWLFQSKGIRSFETENKSPILFLATVVLAVNIQQIGSDALKINEILGLDQLQELVFGTNKFEDHVNLITQYLMLFPNEDRGWFITIIGVALLPAVGEELMFRGVFMKLFSKQSNHHNGIALSAFLFAIIHFNLTNFFYYFILGVILGYAYYWGKNILFPIIIHFINNALVVLVYVEVVSTPDDLKETLVDTTSNPYSLISYITVALSLVIFYMHYQRNKYLIK